MVGWEGEWWGGKVSGGVGVVGWGGKGRWEWWGGVGREGEWWGGVGREGEWWGGVGR